MFGTAANKGPCQRYAWGHEPLDGTAESYWSYHEPYYRECRRVLRPGGRFAWASGMKFHIKDGRWAPRQDWFGAVRAWSLKLYYAGGWSANTYGHTWLVQSKEQQPIPFPVADGVIITSPRPALARLHPCPKCVEEMEFMIRNLTRPGEVVLDIFCGLGSTLVAAKRLGRHWIGAEKWGEYAAIAQWRCEQEKTGSYTS
jgi:site-specific DNA-methyltransferase (adenine-specific)